MSRNAVIAVVVALIVITGGWFLTRPKQPVTPSPAIEQTQIPTSTESASPTSATEGAMMKEEKNLVKITANGFSPQNLTIYVGDSVSWMNGDTVDHIINSAVHPTHQVHPSLNLGVIKPGDKKSLTFPTAGTYKYHDHLNPSLTGSVTVQ